MRVIQSRDVDAHIHNESKDSTLSRKIHLVERCRHWCMLGPRGVGTKATKSKDVGVSVSESQEAQARRSLN